MPDFPPLLFKNYAFLQSAIKVHLFSLFLLFSRDRALLLNKLSLLSITDSVVSGP